MNNKNILITGSTDGIGKQTAIELAKKNYNIILHGKNEEKCIKIRNEVIYETGNNNVDFVISDFSDLNDVRKLAKHIIEKYDRLDVLINNAGVYMNEKKLTIDGYETTFAVNHLAPFLLTNLLLELLMKSEPARIINVSSIAHTKAEIDKDNINAEKYYDAYGAYALSKLANVFFTQALALKLDKYKITVNALHPGVITTKLLKTGFNITGNSLQYGAETSVFLADSNEVKNITGKYFVNKKNEESSLLSKDISLINYFWELSGKLVELV